MAARGAAPRRRKQAGCVPKCTPLVADDAGSSWPREVAPHPTYQHNKPRRLTCPLKKRLKLQSHLNWRLFHNQTAKHYAGL
jgi:hypothetical protein